MLKIPWKRFWTPREGTISLGDGGFLTDPEGMYGATLNPDLVSLEQLDDRPCLVLLGEPGIGKSTVAEEHCQRVKQATGKGDHDFIFLDLRSYGSEDRIVRTVFESDTFLDWRRGAGILELYFDSLDECRMRVANVAALLVEQLRDVAHERLRLRIGCRTAEWPALLEAEVRNWFGAQNVAVLELAPLRRVDVQLAATLRGLSPDSFVETLYAAAAVPLAIKPITLEFLLSATGRLPSTQVELYEKGCGRLCQEHNESRLAAGHLGSLSTGERMEVASWLAAAMTFGGKGVVRTAPSSEPIGTNELDVSDLVAPRLKVGEAAIRDVLTVSGLFSSRGPDRLGWAHTTYSEFLTARFLTQHKVPLRQVGDLILHPWDRESVVPQLRETAAWIGSMRPDVFAFIAERDPQVLLASDVAKADPSGRQRLVEQLLRAFDTENAIDDNWDEYAHYRKLNHPTLSQQLQPFIKTHSKNTIARRVAVDIAEQCDCQDLVDELVAIALDKSEDRQIRQQAAHAVTRLGDDTALLKLKPLLSCDADEDPDHELLGLVLRALYPKVLSPADFFASIVAPREDSFFGTYDGFLSTRAHDLSRDELPEALSWAVRTHPERHNHSDRLNTLREAAVREGWAYVADARIQSDVVQLVESRLLAHENPFGSRDHKDVERPTANSRRTVSRALLERLKPEQATLLLYGQAALLDWDDFDWLMEQFETGPGPVAAANLAKIIASLSWREGDPARLSRLIGLAQSSPGLHAEMAEMIDPVDLDSPRAAQMRETYRAMMSMNDREEPPRVADPVSRIEKVIAGCESENIEAWWQLTRDISLKPNDMHYRDGFSYRLTEFASWATLSADTQARVIALARRYILEGEPANDAWFGTDHFRNSALSGYRALQLVFERDPAWLESLDASALRKWVRIIGCYPSKPNEHLTRLAWIKCPADLLSTVIEHLDQQRAAVNVDASDILDQCWTEDIARALAAKAEATDSPGIQNALVDQGLRHGDEGFAALAGKLLRMAMSPAASSAAKDAHVALLSTVIRKGLAPTWSAVMEVMQTDRDVARDALLQVASRLHRDIGPILDPLTPHQLADLFIWLATEFPPNENRRRSGWIGPEESIADFRDAVLGHLKKRGDWRCLAAIDRIANALPHLPFMRLHRLQARRAAAQATWQPLLPLQLATLVTDARQRFIANEGQLLSVVLESMERLRAALHDELSGIRDLWDKTPSAWRPVEETDLSNRIARHLRADLEERGVIVNREVKIRRGLPGLEGQQTDIYVDALAPNEVTETLKRLSVVIEVKGCWNKEVLTALEDQLAARYLRDNSCDHGLYVVGWFTCEGWDHTDPRRMQALRLLPTGLEDAGKLLGDQASMASRDGKVIRSFLLDATLHADSR